METGNGPRAAEKGERIKLLLHVCCGPCSTHVLEQLAPECDVIAYFYNPNIEPEEEYTRRLEAAKQACTGLVEGPCENEKWREAVKGLAGEPEGGERCLVCYRFRLAHCAAQAKERGAARLATTLSVGPAKRATEINRIGEEVAASPGLAFYAADFKKQDGYRRSVELSKEMGLYRQSYCGCSFGRKGER